MKITKEEARQLLREYLERTGKRQYEVAALLDVSPQQVSHIKVGRSGMSKKTYLKFLDLLDEI